MAKKWLRGFANDRFLYNRWYMGSCRETINQNTNKIHSGKWKEMPNILLNADKEINKEEKAQSNRNTKKIIKNWYQTKRTVLAVYNNQLKRWRIKLENPPQIRWKTKIAEKTYEAAGIHVKVNWEKLKVEKKRWK